MFIGVLRLKTPHHQFKSGRFSHREATDVEAMHQLAQALEAGSRSRANDMATTSKLSHIKRRARTVRLPGKPLSLF